MFLGCHQFMAYMGKVTYSDTGQILDSGIDLNMESGIGEHVKDIIILSTFVQILALISAYFWLGLLFVPLRAFQLMWKNVIAPWIFAPGPTKEEDVDAKKPKI